MLRQLLGVCRGSAPGGAGMCLGWVPDSPFRVEGGGDGKEE